MSFEDKKKNVDLVYKNLIEIANSILKPYVEELDNIIEEINSKLDYITIDDIKRYMLKLSINLYSLLDIRDSSEFKKECSSLVLNEARAQIFTTTQGTQDTKKQISVLKTSEENSVMMIYNLVYTKLKTKIDSTYKIIDVLKNLLISKNAEAKLGNITKSVEEI